MIQADVRAQLLDRRQRIESVVNESGRVPQLENLLRDIDRALDRFASLDQRRSRVVELRFFGGLTVEVTADVLRVSPETVKRDWRLARLWLLRELDAPRGHAARAGPS